ncbi:MAG: type II toxin-antitoxin system RelE/ParE family toxin [Dehalococcoidia bacterium]
MKYQVRAVPAAEREIEKLPSSVHTRISGRILSLEDNPRPRGTRKLSGREEYRLRVGDYRVLYTIDDSNRVVIVFAVGHRREVYR